MFFIIALYDSFIGSLVNVTSPRSVDICVSLSPAGITSILSFTNSCIGVPAFLNDINILSLSDTLAAVVNNVLETDISSDNASLSSLLFTATFFLIFSTPSKNL